MKIYRLELQPAVEKHGDTPLYLNTHSCVRVCKCGWVKRIKWDNVGESNKVDVLTAYVFYVSAYVLGEFIDASPQHAKR